MLLPQALSGVVTMSEADLKVNSKVRKILTEYFIDLAQLSVSTTSGAVTVRGELRKLTGHEAGEREVLKLLGVLETVILRTKGVKRVTFYVKGWKKNKGKWNKEDDKQ
jgi:hypothetical protein